MRQRMAGEYSEFSTSSIIAAARAAIEHIGCTAPISVAVTGNTSAQLTRAIVIAALDEQQRIRALV